MTDQDTTIIEIIPPPDPLDDLGIVELKRIAWSEGILDYYQYNSKTRIYLINRIRENRKSMVVVNDLDEFPLPSRTEITELLTEKDPDLEGIEWIFHFMNPNLPGLYYGRDMSYFDIALQPGCIPDVLERMLIGGKYKIDELDVNGRPLLHRAILTRSLRKIKAVLNRGANPEITDYLENTPLYYSIEYSEIAKLLLDAGADPNEEGKEGKTIFEQAIDDGNDELIEKLLRNKRLKTSPESTYLIRAADGTSGYTLLKDRRFSKALFDIDPETGESFLTKTTIDFAEQEDEDTDNPIVFERMMGVEISSAKHSIAYSVLGWTKECMSQMELISIYDTVFTITENFDNGHKRLKYSDEEIPREKNLIFIICLEDMYERRCRFTVDPAIVKPTDGDEITNKERELFFKVPGDIPMDGSVYSYTVPAKIVTWEDLVDSFGLLANYFDFFVEEENINNSQAEIDDGVAVTAKIKRNIVQLL